MGMYDYVVCRYPLPTAPPRFIKNSHHQYQSKSLGCQMSVYEIRDDRTLWFEDYDVEDQSEYAKWKAAHPGEKLPRELEDKPLSGLLGCMTRVNKRWVQVDFDGVVEFYDGNVCVNAYGHGFTPHGEDAEWVSYKAVFLKGSLQQIQEIERECEPALSLAVYHELDRMFQEDEPVIDTSEPEIGAEMYVLWGSVNRNLEGYPVKLIAKTSRAWAFVTPSDGIETIDSAQLGNCLFHSEADAKAQRSWEFQLWDRRAGWILQRHEIQLY